MFIYVGQIFTSTYALNVDCSVVNIKSWGRENSLWSNFRGTLLRPEEIETREMSRLFVAWKPVNGTGFTGRIKIHISISSIFVKVLFWTFVMWQVKTSESLEGIFPGCLINCGKKKKKSFLKRFDSLYKHGRQSSLEPDKLVRFLTKCSYEGTQHAVLIMVSECFVWLRQESSKSIESLKRTEQHWKGIDPMHKWLPIKNSLVSTKISPTNLVFELIIQKN